MDDIFEHWIDKSGRTVSLSNFKGDRSGHDAVWWALTELGYAGLNWDEAGVRVRLVAATVSPGVVDGLVANLRAVRRPIALEIWDGSTWMTTTHAAGGSDFVSYLRTTLPKSQ